MQVGDSLGRDRYRLERRLGSGGMADVYVARDTVLDRDVAVKVLRPTDVEVRGVERFASETRILASLSHPNLVRCYDAGQEGDEPFLVMEYVRGRPLSVVLAEGPLSPGEVRRLGAALARGLAHAHAKGVVHRDVKPSNVLIDDEGEARLTDFGIARLLDAAGVTQTGQTLGTAAYLAPEQLTGEPVGPPCDVYALGLVLLEAVTGATAFTGRPVEVAHARLTRDPEVPADIPEDLATLLRDATRREPAARPTAGEVAAAFDGVASTKVLRRSTRPEVTARQAPARSTAGEGLLPAAGSAVRPGRRSLGVVLAVIGAVLVAVGLLATLRGGGPVAEPASSLAPEVEEALDALDEAVRQ